MAYSELIKNFDGIRAYMREFYVYGFKSRGEFTLKSARSYDDERRRAESWLGDYMRFTQTPEGKNVFLSIDSRVSRRNPLFKAWKAKSFTDGDITLHFIIFDILYSPDTALTLSEITKKIDDRLLGFDSPRTFDASTVRKKLKEYEREGLVLAEKSGRSVLYRRAGTETPDCADALDFFSETAPCGVIGSFLLDRAGTKEGVFAFKHHYITGALDSGILCALLGAMHARSFAQITTVGRGDGAEKKVLPLRIYSSVQSGRQYLMAYVPRLRSIRSIRLDNILTMSEGPGCESYDIYAQKFESMRRGLWGVSTGSGREKLGHVEFTVRFADGEEHIHRRLEREKRCGSVERLDAHTSRFTADVYDIGEMVPWIRTFICRIVSLSFSDKKLEAQFKKDIERMYRIYGIETEGGGEP